MIPYIKHIVESFYLRYRERTFDQIDVALLAMSVRDYTPKKSVFKEIGDFISHPKGKEQGIIFKSIQETQGPFDTYISKIMSDSKMSDQAPVFDSPSSTKTIAKEFESILKNAKIDHESVIVESAEFREFIFCLIFLLSGFKIKLQSSLCSQLQILDLHVSYSRDLTLQTKVESLQFLRTYAVLPIITIRDVLKKSIEQINPPEKILDKHVARRLKNGRLVAISYEQDLSPNPDSVCWPIFNPPEN